MGKITFSVVVTVLNEEASIFGLLTTLVNQSMSPGEIIIVDGGSVDKTAELVLGMANKSKVPIKYLIKPGYNRSRARNFGIEQAKHDYIAVTDAGCEVDRDWLSNLTKEFSESIKAVGGYYLPVIEKPVQVCFAAFTCVPMDRFDRIRFLPSSRSVAFTKKIWQQVGGYPEELDTCEDLVFAKKLFETGKLISTDKAIVWWRQPDNFKEYFGQVQGYARGDVQAEYWPHMVKIISVWSRYLVFVFFSPLLPVYLGYLFFKSKKRVGKTRMIDFVRTQLVTDAAVILGSWRGLKSKFRDR